MTEKKNWKGVLKIIKKRDFNELNITFLKEQLSLLHWIQIDFNGNATEIYDIFLRNLTDIYDGNFPIREYILKDKHMKSLCISKSLKKSSRTKQRLYIKSLKTETFEDESNYKIYKKVKITLHSNFLDKYKTDSERNWQVMKEIIGEKKNKILLPREIKVDKTIAQNPREVGQKFNKYLTSVGPNLAGKNRILEKHFKTF